MKKSGVIVLILVFGIKSLSAQAAEAKLVDTLITIDGKEVYISFPLGIKGKRNVIMAIHGSGREALSYDPNSKKSSPFYVHQRDIAVDNGFLFVVISNGANTWGTDEGLKGLESLYHYICNKYAVKKKWCLWATSAGGVLLARFIKSNPEKVDRAVGTFPVYDLKYEYVHLKSAYKAWGTDTSMVEKVNPVNYPQVFVNVPYLIFHGKSDNAVPLDVNSVRLQRDVNSIGGDVILDVVAGGHSTNNWNVYNDKVIINFLLNHPSSNSGDLRK